MAGPRAPDLRRSFSFRPAAPAQPPPALASLLLRASAPSEPATEPFSVGQHHDDGLGDGPAPAPALLKARPVSSLYSTLLTYWVTVLVAMGHLVTWETVLVCAMQAGATCFYFFYRTTSTGSGGEQEQGEPLVAKLALSFFTFIIVFPVTANIGYAFMRRERALQAVAGLKALIMHLYLAHATWAWPVKGGAFTGRRLVCATPRVAKAAEAARAEEAFRAGAADEGGATAAEIASEGAPLPYDGGAPARQHAAEVRGCLLRLSRGMRDFLALPMANRSKHMYTSSGQRMRAKVRPVQKRLLSAIYEEMWRLSLGVERLKAVGLPGNEAARMNQYLMLLMRDWENCRVIKGYRTPHGLRAFARLYILTHPFFIGPYYAWVAGAGRNLDELAGWPWQTNLAFAISLAVFTGVAMQGLFNVQLGMEDPFDETEGLDDVRLHKIFGEVERLLTAGWAPGAWDRVVMRGGDLADAALESREEELPDEKPVEGYDEALGSEAAMNKLCHRRCL